MPIEVKAKDEAKDEAKAKSKEKAKAKAKVEAEANVCTHLPCSVKLLYRAKDEPEKV